jgi:Outer membrane lipoprotein carrier protein LolA
VARLIALLTLLCVTGAHASEDEAIARIRALLEAQPRIRAEFEQTKQMADLQRPMVARGRMLVWGHTGVIWEMEEPVKNVIVLRENTTVRIDARGRRLTTRAEHDPAAARMGRVLNALLQGDTATLGQWFQIAAQIGAQGWSITLTPRKGPMAAFLNSMQVMGDRFVQAVALDESNGDSTRIRFLNHRDAAPLSEQERELLEVR